MLSNISNATPQEDRTSMERRLKMLHAGFDATQTMYLYGFSAGCVHVGHIGDHTLSNRGRVGIKDAGTDPSRSRGNIYEKLN